MLTKKNKERLSWINHAIQLLQEEKLVKEKLVKEKLVKEKLVKDDCVPFMVLFPCIPIEYRKSPCNYCSIAIIL